MVEASECQVTSGKSQASEPYDWPFSLHAYIKGEGGDYRLHESTQPPNTLLSVSSQCGGLTQSLGSKHMIFWDKGRDRVKVRDCYETVGDCGAGGGGYQRSEVGVQQYVAVVGDGEGVTVDP